MKHFYLEGIGFFQHHSAPFTGHDGSLYGFMSVEMTLIIPYYTSQGLNQVQPLW